MTAIVLALSAVAILIVAINFFRRGGTAYLSWPSGFVGLNTVGQSKLQPVNRERYERIVRRVLKGDLFDTLWISHTDDQYGGLILSHQGKWTGLDVGFYPLKEGARLAAFRIQMEGEGYLPTDESSCNEGLGPEMESLSLEYRVKNDPDILIPLMDRILDFQQGTAGDFLFVMAWREKDGPVGSGVKLVPAKDLLSEVP